MDCGLCFPSRAVGFFPELAAVSVSLAAAAPSMLVCVVVKTFAVSYHIIIKLSPRNINDLVHD